MFQMIRPIRLFSYCIVLALFAGCFYQIKAQSQALNGQIEGVVTDASGAAVPNAAIAIRNTQTGTERQIVSDASGVYRAPLLPLGTYRVTVEVPNFKKLVREGITLVAGQNATVDLGLEAGDVSATVTITSDAPIADPGKIDVGRVMNTREVQNLPLVSRNPYNYSLLQANVVGRPNTEFGVPRVSANGYARRTNFQLDGNVNTQANQAGLRLVPISETFVSEVQLVTNGFSAEFGNTPGLIMNNITPSGTNGIHGSGSYRFRRSFLSSRPFGLSPTAAKPGTKVDDVTGAIGGPIIKDRWHFYGGYEYVTRDFSGRPAQFVNITDATKQRLVSEGGLPASIFVPVIPASQKVNFLIFRTDAQLTDAHRLTGRYIRFTNFSPNNIGGGFNTLQRVQDLDDKSNSLALQLASIFSANVLNEFRYQRAHRRSEFLTNGDSGTGPTITITNIANFGPSATNNTISPIETFNQFQNNLTWTNGNHTMKFGAGMNKIYDFRRNEVSSTYTFPTLQSYIDAYRAAQTATTADDGFRFGYNNYAQTIGNPEIEYRSTFVNLFAQDDWKVNRKLKVSYGLRYDLYDVPNGNPTAPFPASQSFRDDRNNFAPRLGLVYSLRDGNRPTVIRASAGMYYDTVYLVMYENALQQNGLGTYRTFSVAPGNSLAPAFPGTLPSSVPAAAVQSIETVSPDFENMYALHYQAQIEQALSENLSITAGYIHSNGRHLPVYSNINCRPTGAALADGRPVYGTKTTNAAGIVSVTPCVNRNFPQFQNIVQVDSGGTSTYDALTLQLNKRLSQGIQFSLNYTLSKATDNAPERNLQGINAMTQTDPSNREFDRGASVADQRHTLSASMVFRPQFAFENRALRFLTNNNQFGIIALAGSGENYNVVSSFDLNGDGITNNDRPVGFARNSGRAPKTFNVDLRYSRFVNFTERFRLELFAEAINIFNINTAVNFAGTTVTGNTTTNAAIVSVVDPFTGQVRGSLPNFRTLPNNLTYQESRQGQLGVKFIF